VKNSGFAESFRNAWEGIRHTVNHERNFKIHIVMAIAAVLCCIVFQVETVLFVWVVFAIFTVLVTELINTSIEALTDLFCGNKPHPLAKIAKDAAAAAVLLAAVQAAAVAAVVAVAVVSRWF
jgi:diacylglycerol kinase